MTTDQVYRRAMSRERAVAELFACAGTQFDPALVKKFSELLVSDQLLQTRELSERWLRELTRERSNTLWTWNADGDAGLA